MTVQNTLTHGSQAIVWCLFALFVLGLFYLLHRFWRDEWDALGKECGRMRWVILAAAVLCVFFMTR